jgi:hypothetical protein
MKHEVDWALIRFSDQRVQHQNIVKVEGDTAQRECDDVPSEDLYPHRIAGLDELGGLKVHSRSDERTARRHDFACHESRQIPRQVYFLAILARHRQLWR